jgi:hypothetical protein
MNTKTADKQFVLASTLKPGDKFRHQRLVSTVTAVARNGVWFTTSKGKGRIAPKTEVTLIERAKGTGKATTSKKTAAKPAAKVAATPKKTTAKKTTAAPKKAAATKKDEPAKPVAKKTPAKKAAPAKPNTPRKAPAAKKTTPSKPAPKRGRRPVKKGAAKTVGLPQNATKALRTTPDSIEWEYKNGGTVVVWPIWDEPTLTNKYGTGIPVKGEEKAEILSASMESGEFWTAVYVMEKPKGEFNVKCVGGEASFKALNGK